MMEMMKETRKELVNITFTEEEDYISSYELQQFLKDFNIIYLKALDIIEEYNIDTFYDLENKYENIIYSEFPISENEYLYYENRLSEEENDLVIYKLSKHSPFELCYGCVAIAISLSIIFSGGNISFNAFGINFEAKINKSLGEAIQDLKKAFR